MFKVEEYNMDINAKKCKKNCKEEDKICNTKTGRCIKNKELKTEKKKVQVQRVKKSSPVQQKRKECKEDCSILKFKTPRECNYETGRCKVIPRKPVLLNENDCRYNQVLNSKRTKCIEMSYSKRYNLFSKYKAYFTVKSTDVEKAKMLGAQWDNEKQKLYYTHDMQLGKILKLNGMSLEKPKKLFLAKESVPYHYRSYAMDAGAKWDAEAKLWYYFDNLPDYNKYMLRNTDWKNFDYRLTYEKIY